MRDRIKMIMDAENMTPAKFADTLQIGRAVISHILNGRNNPSLDVVIKILTEIPYINSEWLLTGNGNMYQDSSEKFPENTKTNGSNENISSVHDLFGQDLFAQDTIKPDAYADNPKYVKEKSFTPPSNSNQNIVNHRIINQENTGRKISEIIVYYTDNTFETFKMEK